MGCNKEGILGAGKRIFAQSQGEELAQRKYYIAEYYLVERRVVGCLFGL